MPYLAFASNFTWVMVIGLLGPSLPAVIRDLDIGYGRAGLFFTMLSLGSLFGTPLGGIASDYLKGKLLFAVIALGLAAGLISVGLASSYSLILVLILLFSLFGSPAGTVGQSIMLSLYPERRERYLALQTFFAALGSFCAPLLVSLNYAAGLSWRWPFIETGLIALALLFFILRTRLPSSGGGRMRFRDLARVLGHPKVLVSAVLIFFSVGPDLGFSFWLAEHFKAELGAPLGLSSAVVSVYLSGMIAGRLATSGLLRKIESSRILAGALSLACASLMVFLLASPIPVKLAAILLYGLGTAPVFPLLMARGTAVFPRRPGTVSGLLFASVSLGGMTFPLLLGAVASQVGIRRTYFLILPVVAGLLAVLSATRRWWRTAEEKEPAPRR